MNTYLVYRASFYVMLIVASLALVGDSAEGQFAKLYTMAVTVCGTSSRFTQVTVVPATTVNVGGLKLKLSIVTSRD